MMNLERPHTYCMFIGLLPLEMMSADAHDMMSANAHRCECTQMRVFMRRMTLWGSADLRTSLQISLTRGSRDVQQERVQRIEKYIFKALPYQIYIWYSLLYIVLPDLAIYYI